VIDPDQRQLPVDPETDRTWRPVDRAVVAAVFIGGAAGGLARHALQQSFPVSLEHFPWPTLAINCSGAFALALLLVQLRSRQASRLIRPLLGTGFLGGWTTFSAVAAAADEQFAHGHAGIAAGYLLATALGGLLAAFAGFLVGGRRW
jgi:CrcB protein